LPTSNAFHDPRSDLYIVFKTLVAAYLPLLGEGNRKVRCVALYEHHLDKPWWYHAAMVVDGKSVRD